MLSEKPEDLKMPMYSWLYTLKNAGRWPLSERPDPTMLYAKSDSLRACLEFTKHMRECASFC